MFSWLVSKKCSQCLIESMTFAQVRPQSSKNVNSLDIDSVGLDTNHFYFITEFAVLANFEQLVESCVIKVKLQMSVTIIRTVHWYCLLYAMAIQNRCRWQAIVRHHIRHAGFSLDYRCSLELVQQKKSQRLKTLKEIHYNTARQHLKEKSLTRQGIMRYRWRGSRQEELK